MHTPDYREAHGSADAPTDIPEPVPPPDHDGFMEASADGLRAIHERREKRRREK
jgi:hypothetical protein